MDAAWIAVIGTLGGVIATSASAIVVGWLKLRPTAPNCAERVTITGADR